MSRKGLSVNRFTEIKRLLNLGITEREIAFGLKCSRNTIRKIRDGTYLEPSDRKDDAPPLWVETVNWDTILAESERHPLKYIWNDLVTDKATSYVNFWKYFYHRFPYLKIKGYTHREYLPGERSEVDYAGKRIPRLDIITGEIKETPVFVSVLCRSQKIFACATPSCEKRYFFESQRACFEYFGGSTKIIVPDNLKQAVAKPDWYDPDINPDYLEFCNHYGTTVLPARVRKPQDKGLVEGAVKLVMRYFRWIFRNYTFTSVEEINAALRVVTERINESTHTRFKRSRNEMWKEEKDKLIPLPAIPYEYVVWKEATVHPDCHVAYNSDYYSAPYRYRGRKVKLRVSTTHVEIFYERERIAVHPRSHCRSGKYVKDNSHLPPNSRAYLETTPQSILSQAKYINSKLQDLIDELFKKDAILNLRRAQGLVREARKEINAIGRERAEESIGSACNTMRAIQKIRVPYFRQLLIQYRKEKRAVEERKIIRFCDNPNLRYHNKQLSLPTTNTEQEENNGNSADQKHTA